MDTIFSEKSWFVFVCVKQWNWRILESINKAMDIDMYFFTPLLKGLKNNKSEFKITNAST